MDGALFPADIDAACSNWPSVEQMEPEPGDHQRSWCNLVINDQPTNCSIFDSNGNFWRTFLAEKLFPLYNGVRDSLAPFIADRFGTVPPLVLRQLTLMQSELGFDQHPAHTHYRFAPDWIFTVLIHIEDSGDTSRGSRLFRHLEMGEIINGPTHKQAEYALINLPERCETAVDIQFKPGRMVALSEGPWCLHGSTPGNTGAGRKIIRCHVGVPTEAVRNAYGSETGEAYRKALENMANGGETPPLLKSSFCHDMSAPDRWHAIQSAADVDHGVA
tara:strand:+ start:175985 stop:176806 length:822 start_codon:yes stop_codon:yes gene_type:complete